MQRRKKVKRTSGLIIRLIDVVFLLLFGFISISQLNQRSMIRLPQSGEVPPAMPDREEVVFVGVLPGGEFLVENESAVIRDVATLERYLQNKQNELAQRDRAMRVRVRANWDVQMTHVFKAVGSCQRLSIPTGLDVVRVNAN